MTVTIVGTNNLLERTDRLEGVDYDTVTIKETHKRNGHTVTDIRVERGKRAVVFSTGFYNTVTVQDEETGRYLVKLNR